MCAAMVPMIGFAGSAIDMARLYVVKTRMQTACDSGVLAGRKMMDPATPPGTALTGTALTQANAYFNNNFVSSWGSSGWFKVGTQTFAPVTFTDSSGVTQVAGTASAQVPMSLMAFFGVPTKTISVTCQASFNTPDVDVMFVLDTTGSMACLPSDSPTANCGSVAARTLADGSLDYYSIEKSGSKLQAVRDAVKTFYETLAGNMSAGTNVRYGFVPYTSTVNAGSALYSVNPSFIASSWAYQSRAVTADYTVSSTSTTNGTPTSSSTCIAITTSSTRSPSPALTYSSDGTATAQQGSWGGNPSKCTVTTYTYGPQWQYKQRTLPTTAYVQTLSTVSGGTIQDPTEVRTAATAWQGCVEELTSGNYSSASSYNIDALPNDLNPDVVPSTSDQTTMWGPLWQSVEYGRNGLSYSNSDYGFYNGNTDTENGDNNTLPDSSNNIQYNNSNYANYTMRSSGGSSCSAPAKRLTTWTESAVVNYMAALQAHGGTYHDTGMIWGLRMISPQGIFAADTAKWAGHADPKRVIVFLTDGAMSTSSYIYGMTGMESLDKRVRGSSTTDLDDYHNARFLAECSKAQEKNIQVYVVAVGQSLTPSLQSCVGSAHPERAITVNSSTDLSAAFKTIATAVAMLRVSQ